MSLEQKIQTLKEDFLDRDQTTFVKIRRTGRLGWESSIPEGTPYSDYMLSPASDEELIKNSYRLAEDMIKVMDTPFKVRVRISPDSSRTTLRYRSTSSARSPACVSTRRTAPNTSRRTM